ncbi:MAG: dihydropyrimidinase [Lachnospiraceae bacterium]|jgi:dihydropyrimidinase|nr:dihydropyrimidinase [Lachnospiraceae bacterium]
MSKSNSFLIKNATVVTPDKAEIGDVLVNDGIISAIVPKTDCSKSDCCSSDRQKVNSIDATGLILLPGAIDSHVHFHMPTSDGGYNADDFYSGTKGAICGGTTTIIDFASPIQDKNWIDAINKRRADADGKTFCDYQLHMEVTGAFPQDYSTLKEIKSEGLKVLKVYTTYGNDMLSYEQLSKLYGQAKEDGFSILAHCEDDNILNNAKNRLINKGQTAAKFHPKARPPEAEVFAVKKLIELCEKSGVPTIIAHISTAEAALLVKAAKKRGVLVYAETCPHYLLLNERVYSGLAPERYIMSPPLRTEKDSETLMNLVASGDISVISTDHCPFNLSDKLKKPSCFEALFGVGGCENMVSLLFSQGVGKGLITLSEFSKLTSETPARLYGLYPEKGVIEVGSDADLILINPNKKRILSAANEKINADYSIWEGTEVNCSVEMVFLRGVLVALKNKIQSEPIGIFVN